MHVIRNYIISSALALLTVSAASGMEKVTLQLKWLHQFQFAGFYAAADQGYYAEEGLEVEMLEVNPTKKPTRSVLDGDAQFGVSSSDILLLRAQNEPVVALAAIFQHSPHIFAATQGGGIESIHDLAGKRIMMEPESADLLALLYAELLPVETIEFVPHSYSSLPLHQGQVDAMSAYITDEPFELRALGQEPIMFNPRSAGIDFYGDVLFTTDAYLKANPDTVAAFRRASLRGWKFALDNPEDVIDLIIKNYPTRKSREALEYEAKRTAQLIRADIIEIGYMHTGRWEHMAEVLHSLEMIETIPDIKPMLYRDTLPFSQRYPLKIIAICALCISLITLVAWKQWRGRQRLESEIKRRKEGEALLREREEEYRSMIEGAPLAFIVWDTHWKISRWNTEAEVLFGWTAEEAIGQSMLDLILPPDQKDQIEHSLTALKSENSRTQTNQNTTKDGRLIWCKWHNVPRKDTHGNVIETHSIAADITTDIERELRLKSDREQALSASEAKGLLLARTSHEIRNPLNAIMGFTQLIHSDAQDPETKEMAKVILDGAEAMLTILNDLLDSAKIEAGKMHVEWEELDLTQIVQKEVKLFSQLIDKQGLQCHLSIQDSMPKVTSDPRCLQQILSNLISNARKFTHTGKIEIKLAQEGPKHVSIEVSDTGIGIAPETLEQIFEPFVQASSQTARDFGGTGLGLSLTRKLAELIGGTLNAKSELGRGSTFTLRLPLTPQV